MKKHLVHIAALLLLSCILFSCKSDDQNTGSIIGSITDQSTGERLPDAKVVLASTYEETTTGEEGTFLFTGVESGDHKLLVSKLGYQYLISDVVTVNTGKIAVCELQLEQTTNPMQVIDIDGSEITELDFGEDINNISKEIYIYNGKAESITYTITKTANWIESFSSPTGNVGPGEKLPVNIQINRELLASGDNETNVLITSPGSKDVNIKVKAKGENRPFVFLDNDGNVINELDFGSDDEVTSKVFKIFNGGSGPLVYTITKDADWIISISKTEGSVEAGGSQPITVKISRGMLDEGLNVTTLVISSPTAGTKEFDVKATKGYNGGGGGDLSDTWLYYGAEDNHQSVWGLNNGGSDEWAVMFPEAIMSQYYGSITRVRAFVGETGTYTLKIYKDGASQPGTLLAEQSFYVSVTGWNTITLSPALALPNNTSLWVSLCFTYNAGAHPCGACPGIGNPNARWKHNNGTWYDVYKNNQGNDLCWEIQTYISSTEKGKEGLEIQLPQSPVNNDNMELQDRDERK